MPDFVEGSQVSFTTINYQLQESDGTKRDRSVANAGDAGMLNGKKAVNSSGLLVLQVARFITI
ncbi:MAG: hypothetical protein K6L73_13185 [Cellvibrionaceae bacterium]